MLQNNDRKTDLIIALSVIALAASISFFFIQKPFVHESVLMDSYHLARQSDYFTDSVVGQSLLDQRFTGTGIKSSRSSVMRLTERIKDHEVSEDFNIKS